VKKHDKENRSGPEPINVRAVVGVKIMAGIGFRDLLFVVTFALKIFKTRDSTRSKSRWLPRASCRQGCFISGFQGLLDDAVTLEQ